MRNGVVLCCSLSSIYLSWLCLLSSFYLSYLYLHRRRISCSYLHRRRVGCLYSHRRYVASVARTHTVVGCPYLHRQWSIDITIAQLPIIPSSHMAVKRPCKSHGAIQSPAKKRKTKQNNKYADKEVLRWIVSSYFTRQLNYVVGIERVSVCV